MIARWFGKLSFRTQFVLVWLVMLVVGLASLWAIALGAGLAIALSAQSAKPVPITSYIQQPAPCEWHAPLKVTNCLDGTGTARPTPTSIPAPVPVHTEGQ